MNAGALAGALLCSYAPTEARLWMMHGHLLLNAVAGKQVLVGA
jgi:hypothetical protein